MLRARFQVLDLTRRVDLLVDRRVAVAGVVERPFAGEEVVEIAVGIGAAAPGEELRLVVALLREIERGGELGGMEV